MLQTVINSNVCLLSVLILRIYPLECKVMCVCNCNTCIRMRVSVFLLGGDVCAHHV